MWNWRPTVGDSLNRQPKLASWFSLLYTRHFWWHVEYTSQDTGWKHNILTHFKQVYKCCSSSARLSLSQTAQSLGSVKSHFSSTRGFHYFPCLGKSLFLTIGSNLIQQHALIGFPSALWDWLTPGAEVVKCAPQTLFVLPEITEKKVRFS